jgi:hypothetical protein
MSREERKNMILFLEQVRGLNKEQFVYMTDADLEHIYSTTYNFMELLAE